MPLSSGDKLGPPPAALMDLKPGDKLGDRYQLLSKLGSGGMGEVWKARDTELDRDVALKVSKGEFTARFKQEARTIAAFNHPNICQIYDVGSNYIVMELIDGVQLSGPLPVDKAVAYAGQILDALDAAHRKGFTHRDLKPANVMVTAKGVVKLLDFGLAKQRVRELGPDDVTGAALTKEGNITGTLQYMSPEQLNGKEADARSDIFAFGCVLYEMLSGKKAFSGSTTASVIAAIMEREPEPLETAPPLDRVIRKCLMKDPDERFQTARDLKTALLWAVEGEGASSAPSRSRLSKMGWFAAVAATLVAVVFAVLYFRATTVTAPETRLDIVTPATNNPAAFALSPDGRKIAYVASGDGASRLWVRSLDSTSAQPLPGTENAYSPFWSPDSRSLGFFADQKLKRIDLGGGQPQSLADVATTLISQGAWSEQGVILFNPSAVAGLSRVPASGGQVVAVTKLEKGQLGHRAPRFLPGGNQFLFTSYGTDAGLWLGSLNAGEPRRISAFALGTESAGEYLAPGWLVRVRGNVLAAQRFDTRRGQLSGDPVTLAQGVGINQISLAGSFSVSPSGTIAWRTGGGGKRQLIWFNRAGQNVGAWGAPDEANLRFPELSPDGKRVAITRGPNFASDLWIEEGARNSRFTFGQGNHLVPIWSPDGKRVEFTSNGKGGVNDLYQKPANGSGSEELLFESADGKQPDSWSPDGRFILYRSGQNNGDLMVLPLAPDQKTTDGKPYAFLSTPFNEQNGVFSPDGKWVAYQSDESGRHEIYVRPFPGPGGQWQVSTGGGRMPRWRGDGKELYYLSPDLKLMAAGVTVQGASLAPGTPEALFQTHVIVNPNRQYDVGRDGRFLIATDLESASSEPIHLLLNWKPPK